jgi:hypothetical protein
MWFFQSGNETFCIRYFREGYGLFIDGEYLSWQKDAEAAAQMVSEHRTGHEPWDNRGTAKAPKDLSEWKLLAEIQGTPDIKPTHDPIVVPLGCDCGHQIRESVARIRILRKFRCPSCQKDITVGDQQLMEIMAKVQEEYPNGLIKSLSRK